MSLIDDLVINLRNLNKSLSVAKETISKEAMEVKKVTSTKLDIIKNNRELSSLYEELGKRLYNSEKYGDILESEDLIEKIDEIISRIHALEASLKLEKTYSNSFYEVKKEVKDEIEMEDEGFIYLDEDDLK